MKITILSMGSRGDVQPCVAVACGLQREGFRVRIAAPTRYAPLIGRHGIECFPVSRSLRQLFKADPQGGRLREKLDPMRLILRPRREAVPVLDQILQELWEACQGADVILYTPLTLAGFPMASLQKKAGFLLCFQPLARTREFPSVLFPGGRLAGSWLNYLSHLTVERLACRFFRPAVTRWQRRVSREPLHAKGCFGQFYAQRGVIFNGYSSCIVPRPGDWDRHIHVTGYWFLDEGEHAWQPPAELLDFLADGEPPVGIDFGSMNDNRVAKRTRSALLGLLENNKKVVVLTGGSHLDPEELPGSERVLTSGYVPHGWLLPRLSMLIHHGGSGTTAAALRAGIPSLIMPFFYDQFFWARQLQRLGVGPAPIRCPHRLAGAMTTVERDRRMQERLIGISRQIASEKGVDNMVHAFKQELSYL